MNDQRRTTPENGFTLVEILTVIAIIGILAAIIVPLAGGAKKTAQKRRAALEMQSIKVAILQYYDDFNYMPWPGDVKAGADQWATTAEDQENVMEILTAVDAANNKLNKIYLQIPEKSRPSAKSMVFNDPWGQPYRIGMDRDLDGVVTVAGTALADWDGKKVVEKVLVCSPGPPDAGKPMKTFDVR